MATKQFNSRIQWKRDTSANWTTNNPVLLDGEIIIVDTNAGETRFKIGNGTSTYTQLPFQDEYVLNQIPNVSEYVTAKDPVGVVDTVPPTFDGHTIEDFVLQSQVVNSLSSTSTTLPLSANQGNILNQNITSLNQDIASFNQDITSLNQNTSNLSSNISDAFSQINTLSSQIGNLPNLQTSNKENLVAAINETFTSASNGKQIIATAITGMGVTTSASDTYQTMANNIQSIETGVKRMVANDTSIVPTGTYATNTYYNTSFGVLISYAPNGDVVLTMKGGTTTTYENLYYVLVSAPDGVTMEFVRNTGASSTAGRIYSCVLHNIQTLVNIAIAMNSRNSSNDYTQCNITITEV